MNHLMTKCKPNCMFYGTVLYVVGHTSDGFSVCPYDEGYYNRIESWFDVRHEDVLVASDSKEYCETYFKNTEGEYHEFR